MKAVDLVVGQKYWCGWASRYARFVKFEKITLNGEFRIKAIFRDVCDCLIDCSAEQVEKWVIPCD